MLVTCHSTVTADCCVLIAGRVALQTGMITSSVICALTLLPLCILVLPYLLLILHYITLMHHQDSLHGNLFCLCFRESLSQSCKKPARNSTQHFIPKLSLNITVEQSKRSILLVISKLIAKSTEVSLKGTCKKTPYSRCFKRICT